MPRPRWDLIWILCLVGCGSSSREGDRAPVFSGQYTATAQDGRNVELTLEEVDGMVRAEGRVGDAPFVATARRLVIASGTTLDEKGNTQVVQFSLGPSGRRATIWTRDLGALKLDPHPGTPGPASSGPFRGTFRHGATTRRLQDYPSGSRGF